MRVRGSSDEGNVSFQIAPMVDVVFILMLFFMASAAQQVHEQQLAMSLPAMGTSDKDAPPMTMQVDISGNGLISCGAQGSTLAAVDTPTDQDLPELISKLKYAVEHSGPKTPVIVNPDGDALHQRVVDVLNACMKAGVKNVSFAS